MEELRPNLQLSYEDAEKHIFKEVMEHGDMDLVNLCFLQNEKFREKPDYLKRVYLTMVRNAVGFAQEGNWKEAIFLFDVGPSFKTYEIGDDVFDDFPFQDYRDRGIGAEYERRKIKPEYEQRRDSIRINEFLSDYIWVTSVRWVFTEALEPGDPLRDVCERLVNDERFGRNLKDIISNTSLNLEQLNFFLLRQGVSIPLIGKKSQKKAA